MTELPPASEPTPPSVKTSQPVSIVVWLLAAILLISVGLNLYLFMGGGLPGVTPVSNETTEVTGPAVEITEDDETLGPAFFTFEPLPASTVQAYPLSANEEKWLVPLTGGTPIDVNASQASSYTLGLGISSFLGSPDFQKVAYLNPEGQVVVATADGEHEVVMPVGLSNANFSGWSSDSRYLLAYSNPGTIPAAVDGMWGPENQLQPFIFNPVNWPGGFYLIDIVDGTVRVLPPLTSVASWLGPDQILANYSDPVDTNLVIYNPLTGAADYQTAFDALAGYFGPQISVNADGTRWALTLNNSTETSQIVLADFPSTEGDVIVESRFAGAQGPIISPDGTKVIYFSTDEVNGPNYLELWQDGNSQRIGEGFPLAWVNDTQFLYAEMNPNFSSNPASHVQQLMLYDLTTGQATSLFQAN